MSNLKVIVAITGACSVGRDISKTLSEQGYKVTSPQFINYSAIYDLQKEKCTGRKSDRKRNRANRWK